MGSIILYKSPAVQEEKNYSKVAWCTDEPKDTLKALCRKYIIWDYLGSENLLSTAENEMKVTNHHGLVIRANPDGNKGPLGNTVTDSILTPAYDLSGLERAVFLLSQDTVLKVERTEDDLKRAIVVHLISKYSNMYNRQNTNENYIMSYDNAELRERKKRFYLDNDKKILTLLEATNAMLGIKTREELRALFKSHNLPKRVSRPED